MPNQFTSLGFDVHQDGGIEQLAYLTSRNGEPLAAPAGYYLYYRVDPYIELWGQANPSGTVSGCVPHYTGQSRITFGVGDLIRRSDHPLDGSVYGWVNPTGSRFDQGDYPLVVHIPDFDIFRTRVAPHMAITLQITGFANEIAVFIDDAAFDAAQDARSKLASESFIPSGLFADTGSLGEPPAAQAIFSGHVRTTDIRTNALTGHDYYHSLVATYGGIYDIVVDPVLLAEAPIEGRVIRGSFSLTGRLVS
jgi:hypothetical protein